jgi:hypothetical protein
MSTEFGAANALDGPSGDLPGLTGREPLMKIGMLVDATDVQTASSYTNGVAGAAVVSAVTVRGGGGGGPSSSSPHPTKNKVLRAIVAAISFFISNPPARFSLVFCTR